MQGKVVMLVLFILVHISTVSTSKLVEIDGKGVQKVANKVAASSDHQQSDAKKHAAEAETTQVKESSHTAEKPSTHQPKHDSKMGDAQSQGGAHTENKPEVAATAAQKDAKMVETKSQGGTDAEGKPAAAATPAKKDGASLMDKLVDFFSFPAGSLMRKEKKNVPEAKDINEVNATSVPNRFKHLLDEEDEDVALDELEAMTIAAALNGKKGPPAVDCEWTEWKTDPSPDGDCSKTCGKGKKRRIRGVHEEQHGGRPCDGPLEKWISCDERDCPTTTTTTTEAPTTTTAGVPRAVGVSLLAYLVVIACGI